MKADYMAEVFRKYGESIRVSEKISLFEKGKKSDAVYYLDKSNPGDAHFFYGLKDAFLGSRYSSSHKAETGQLYYKLSKTHILKLSEKDHTFRITLLKMMCTLASEEIAFE